MKKIVLALALIPVVASAANKGQERLFADAPVLKSFTCQKYTDNGFNFTNGYTTDNPIVPMTFHIEQTKYEFVIKKNHLFDEDLRMTIPEGGNISGIAGTLRDMFFRRIDGNGDPYFLIYLGNRNVQSNGDINRAVNIAGCKKD